MMTTRFHPPDRRCRFGRIRGLRGFTLIELLVVISIIALLMGILMPALAGSRRAARDSQCKSQLKQIGIAVAAFAVDHHDELPDTGSDGTQFDNTTNLTYYVNTNWTSGIWACPAQDLTGITYTSSYGYNWQYLIAPSSGTYPLKWPIDFQNPGIKHTYVRRPSEVLSFIDHEPSTGNQLWSYVLIPEVPPVVGLGIPHLRHMDLANTLFIDGHVTALDASIKTADSVPKHWDPTQ